MITACTNDNYDGTICFAKQKMAEIGEEMIQTFELIKDLQTENENCISKLKELNTLQIFEKQKLIDREIDLAKVKKERVDREKEAAIKQIAVLKNEKQKQYHTFKKTTNFPKRVTMLIDELNVKIRDKYVKIENEYDVEIANLDEEITRLISSKSNPENLPQIQDIDDYEKMVTYVSQLDETIKSNTENIREITDNIPTNLIGRELQEFQRQKHIEEIRNITNKINQKIANEKKARANHLKIKRDFQKQKNEFNRINMTIKTVEEKSANNKTKINDSIETVRTLLGDAVGALTSFGLGLISITYNNENWDDAADDDWDADDGKLDSALQMLNNVKNTINIISTQNNDSILSLVSSDELNMGNMNRLLEGVHKQFAITG
jgi:hypothetical protein